MTKYPTIYVDMCKIIAGDMIFNRLAYIFSRQSLQVVLHIFTCMGHAPYLNYMYGQLHSADRAVK